MTEASNSCSFGTEERYGWGEGCCLHVCFSSSQSVCEKVEKSRREEAGDGDVLAAHSFFLNFVLQYLCCSKRYDG